MKTKTWILILGVVVILCAVLSVFLMASGSPAARAEISSNGDVVKIVDLHMDQEFTISAPDGGSNTVTVRDGKIAVTAADCPDGYCMDRGFCDSGAQIVCLPHRLIIRFLGAQEIDGMVG